MNYDEADVADEIYSNQHKDMKIKNLPKLEKNIIDRLSEK